MKLDKIPDVSKRQLTLNNVRVNWVSVFEPRVPQNSDSGRARYEIVAILDPEQHKSEIKQVKKILKQLAEEVLETQLDEIERSKCPLKKPRGKDVEKQPAYEGMFILPAYSPADKPVQVVDRNMALLTKGSPKPYSGCFCNVAVEFYVSKTQADAIYCALNAVQFVEDGESLGGSTAPKADELFKKLDDEDDDFDDEDDDDLD
jgi:hypothetical protein